jgi:hypothetical protein
LFFFFFALFSQKSNQSTGVRISRQFYNSAILRSKGSLCVRLRAGQGFVACHHTNTSGYVIGRVQEMFEEINNQTGDAEFRVTCKKRQKATKERKIVVIITQLLVSEFCHARDLDVSLFSGDDANYIAHSVAASQGAKPKQKTCFFFVPQQNIV